MTDVCPSCGRATSRGLGDQTSALGVGAAQRLGNKPGRQQPPALTLSRERGETLQHLTERSGEPETCLQGFKHTPVPRTHTQSMEQQPGVGDSVPPGDTQPTRRLRGTLVPGPMSTQLSPGLPEKRQPCTTSLHRAQLPHLPRPRTTVDPSTGRPQGSVRTPNVPISHGGLTGDTPAHGR